MLSRVADNLFWMGRYIERAEQIARLLDVSFLLELDLQGLVEPHRETGPSYAGIADVVTCDVPESIAESDDPKAFAHWLSFEFDNPASILSCVNRARNNCRSIRGTISSEMWRELNKLYWQLRDPDFEASAKESPHDYYQAVQVGSYLLQGISDATLSRDEGFYFIQLGRSMERVEKTLRILGTKYRLVERYTAEEDLPLASMQLAALLRLCLAYEPYQRLYISKVERESVVDFLLLNDEFPRSVRFGLESAAQALDAIGAPIDRRKESADRILGRIVSDLKYADSEQLLAGDLHAFLESVQMRCNHVSAAIQSQYSLT